MIFTNYYIDYFKWQAINHPDLAHDDAEGSRVFEVIDVEEALGDFRGAVKEKAFIFRLILYTYEPRLAEGEIMKNMQGGFIIAHSFSARDGGGSDHLQALTLSEQVVDQIIAKMIADSRNGHPLFEGSFDTPDGVIVTPVVYTGDSSYAGWRVLFDLASSMDICIPGANAPDWIDEGVTPFSFG